MLKMDKDNKGAGERELGIITTKFCGVLVLK